MSTSADDIVAEEKDIFEEQTPEETTDFLRLIEKHNAENADDPFVFDFGLNYKWSQNKKVCAHQSH